MNRADVHPVRWRPFLGLACFVWCMVTCFTALAERRPPNIVFILADDLGYGDLGCFGQEALKTPRLDKMAERGLRFTQFYAGCTVCAPSRSVLLTGRHGGDTVVRGNSTQPIVIEPGQPTVASMLKEGGYSTACIGKWGIGTPDNLTNPNDVGFDHFFGYVNMWHAHNFYPEFLIRNGEVVRLDNVVGKEWKEWQDPSLPQAGRGVAEKRAQYAPDLFIDDALRFIRENHEKPFFLYFAMNVPHANNEAGNEGMEVPDLGEFASKDWPSPEKGFAAMIKNIDRDTGRILDLLAELGIAENTLVIFTSDNGPHQEGGHKADFFDSNGKYRGIKRDLYEGGIRVPAIAWWPGTIEPGGENDHAWYFGDLMATAAELAGVESPAAIDSDSFAPVLRGEYEAKQWARNSPLYWEFYERGSAQAVRFGKWKAIRSPMFTGDIELYDLSWDHDEDHNYAARRPDLVRHAVNLLDKQHEPDPNWKTDGKPGPVMDAETIRAGLKSHDRALYIKTGWIRDPFIALAPDGYYYLTGTTPNPDDPREDHEPYNTGLGEESIVGYHVRVWRSRDLIEWESLGAPFSLLDGYWAKKQPEAFAGKDRSGWHLWAPELHFFDGRWHIVHTTPAPVRRGSNLAVTKGETIEGPYTFPLGDLSRGRHDPSLFRDDNGTVYLLWGNTMIAPLTRDLSGLAAEAVRIDPAGSRPGPEGEPISRIGHEGATIRKIGEKYVHFGTAWSTDRGRQGSYNLYYCTADKVTGPYGPRRFAGRFLGHGTPFQDKDGRWWCTAFFNGDVPPLSRNGIESRDLGKTAQTINEQGLTIVPLDVQVAEDGGVRIRAIDPAYANPGPDEVQQFPVVK